MIVIPKLTVTDVRRLKGNKSSPYVVYCENKKSSHLLVYFGSYSGDFAGMTNVESLQCNAIFIRSNESNWYVQEYGENFPTPKEFALEINKFIKTLNHVKTICIAGFSMGGYGALMFGSWIGANRIVATAPQTKFPEFPVANNIPTYPIGFDDTYANIITVWETHGVPTAEVIIQCCDKVAQNEHFMDVNEATELYEKFPDKIELILHSCNGHKGITKSLLDNKENYEKLFIIL